MTNSRFFRRLAQSVGYDETQKLGIDKLRRINENRDTYQNICSCMFAYDGFPATIPSVVFERMLQLCGSVVVWRVPDRYTPNGFGPSFDSAIIDTGDTTVDNPLYVFPMNLSEAPDPYGMPYKVNITNPGFTPTISETGLVLNRDCVAIRSDTAMRGLYGFCDYFARLTTEAELSLFSTIITLRDHMTYIVKTDNQRKAVEKYMEALQNGQFAIVQSNDLGAPMTTIPHDGRINTIENAVNAVQSIRAMFFNAIGLNPSWTTKREYTSAQEIDVNSDLLKPPIDDMLKWREIGVDLINKLYGTNITVRKASAWEMKERIAQAGVELAEAEVEATEQSAEAANQIAEEGGDSDGSDSVDGGEGDSDK